MKSFDVLAKSATACAVALVIAGCGGGGSDGGSSAPPPAAAATKPSVQVSGTAATGAALADATVAVKCATGSGTATTDASGAYTLKLEGALPCMIKVTGTQGGVEVTLHSLAEAGTTSAASGTTTASANVTPLTEMIVAQLSAGLPADLFTAFGADSSGQVSTDKLVAATNAVLTALKDATGIDLGSIDPFKTQLVAATTSAPDAGNAYDKLLDELGTKVSTESLAQVVNQIAAAAGSGSAGGLGEVMASVDKGSLPGCPVALSGKYWVLDFFGRISVRDLDFKAMKANSASGQPLFDITADPAKPCEFTLAGVAEDGGQRVMNMVMGHSGLGAMRGDNLTTVKSSVGYIFPVQAHAASALTGNWTMLQSGYVPNEGGFVHWLDQMDIKADGKIDICDYVDGDFSTCKPDLEANLSVGTRTDGGFDVIENSGQVASMYGYRAPNGTLTVFGTTNAAGVNTPDTEQTNFVLTKPQTLTVPAVGAVTKYWDALLGQFEGTRETTLSPESTTVTAVDGNVLSRVRSSDSRPDTVHLNEPLPGLRKRDAGIWNSKPFAAAYQLPLTGLGATVSINAAPAGPGQTYFYSISVIRP